MIDDDELERAIGEWLLRKESAPELLPGAFARELDESLRAPFLRELELLAEVDRLATQAMPRDLPLRYGDFRVLGELGRGAMGAVYDAEQVTTGKRVALKVMHPHIAKDLHSAARFQREARTAASLEHPGIVEVLDFGETDGTAWLAMARVEGRSLQRLLAATKDPRDVDHERADGLFFDKRQLARALADAADALEFAHRNGVVHRDVKPANLMCTEDGRMVVLDFGLATAREAELSALTRTGDFLGTPVYMAPEQAVGAENGTAASDVYSLGAVLYECLCGRPPVSPGPLATVIDSILNRDPIDPRRVRAGVPEELARIAMQCLEKEPTRRYATAAAFADDLRRYVDGNGVYARHVGVVQRSLRGMRRRPAVAALLLVVALLAPAVWIGWQTASSSDVRAATLQRRSDLVRVDELLGQAPERVTAFGGASLRFYARLGLGEHIAPGEERRSAQASEALRLAEAAVQQAPDDLHALRVRARARLDVGDDRAAADVALRALLAHADATDADRMMAAVHARQCGREVEAERLRAGVAADEPAVAFWLGFWHQEEQDHAAAIEAFSRALRGNGLDTDQRYLALLHRGWCRTCPDVGALQQAEDDLLQAAALRPRFATARLLWAALRCLEATEAAQLDEPVAAVNEALKDAEPWLHVLTARVLLALAEGGTLQAGPAYFGAEFSPIAVMPVPAAFAPAFAGIALSLLDGARAAVPFEAGFHRIAALALVGRHGDALAAADELAASQPGHRAVIEVQRARVQLAAGRASAALATTAAALQLDGESFAAWRFRAQVAAHVGDATEELAALVRAIDLLRHGEHDSSVFPDAAALLPELQLRRVRVLASLGQTVAALDLLRDGPFGGVVAGEFSPRVQWRRALLQSELGGTPAAERLAALPASSPLRWVAAADAVLPATVDPALRLAVQRDWLPAALERDLAGSPADARLTVLMAARGLQAPTDIASAPLQVLIANVSALVSVGSEAAAEVLAAADRALATDPANGEARLLRALVLHLTKRSREALEVLSAGLPEQGHDLRCRYLLAAAAKEAGDTRLLQLALRQGDEPLTAHQIDCAGAALTGGVPLVAGTALLQELR